MCIILPILAPLFSCRVKLNLCVEYVTVSLSLLFQDSSIKRIELKHLKQESDLDNLNVKQLKDLLAMNRVDYKGCIERTELLERAKMLWQDNARFKDGKLIVLFRFIKATHGSLP